MNVHQNLTDETKLAQLSCVTIWKSLLANLIDNLNNMLYLILNAASKTKRIFYKLSFAT